MQEWIVAFAAVTGLSAAGFVVVAVLWLRKLRETVASALTESANQQIQTARRFSEAIAQIQKQQHGYEQQLQNLTQANSQLRQGLVNMASQLQQGQVDAVRVEPTLH
jgi:chromosome segregation ATPase